MKSYYDTLRSWISRIATAHQAAEVAWRASQPKYLTRP